MSADRVRPARGRGAPAPHELLAGTCVVLQYLSPDAGWQVECFVDGTDLVLREARDAGAEFVGGERVALLTTKVGGQSAAVDVVEVEPPPPPKRTARSWDEAVDAPDPAVLPEEN